ncbi:MAG: hypothetical protein JW891_13925 [Candidatus Lokiarchaeota archaeon]|nr:hypothetical protein [Candidatus Lokiarchaeota archaeon]
MDPENIYSIEVECPFCKAVGNIKIPASVLSSKKWGTIKVQVPAGAICGKHHFIALIDSQGIVRGHEKIESFTRSDENRDRRSSLTLNELISFFSFEGMACLIHATMFNFRIFMQSNKLLAVKYQEICSFFYFLLPEEYRDLNKLVILEEAESVNMSDLKKDGLVINAKNKIIHRPWKESIAFAESILTKSLEIIRAAEQVVILQQEIAKFFALGDLAKQILESHETVPRSEFITELQQKSKISKIDKNKLSLVNLFLNRHYSPSYWKKITKK